MALTGRCYCGGIRYQAEGQPMVKGQCLCRECQYITGGGPNIFLVMPAEGFAYEGAQPATFARSDLPAPVTREFCPTCGTHLTTRLPGNNGSVIVKVGTLDDRSAFDASQIVIWTDDAQAYHHIPDGAAAFPGFPPRG